MNMNSTTMPAKMAAPDAQKLADEGKLMIVDIRSPGEWMRSGIAKGAKTISVHSNSFLDDLDAAMNNDKSTPIALICATGSRTAQVQNYLLQNGYANVIDISEGMMGSMMAPGWIMRGLPTESYAG